MRGETVWVLGGDLRQSWLARLLAREDRAIALCRPEELPEAAARLI